MSISSVGRLVRNLEKVRVRHRSRSARLDSQRAPCVRVQINLLLLITRADAAPETVEFPGAVSRRINDRRS
jgi:hypothetical protein